LNAGCEALPASSQAFALYDYSMDNGGLRYPGMGAITLTTDFTEIYGQAYGRTPRTQQPSISPASLLSTPAPDSTPTQTVFIAEVIKQSK
jgi:hypothetical protein